MSRALPPLVKMPRSAKVRSALVAIFGASLIAFVGTSCGGNSSDKKTGEVVPTPEGTKQVVAGEGGSNLGLKVKTYFELKCMGCHSSISPNVTDFESLRAGSGRAGKFIDIEDPQSSVIVQVLSSRIRQERGSSAAPMPPGGADADPADLQNVLDWVQAGAPDAEREPTDPKKLEELRGILSKVTEQYTKKIEPIFAAKCFACHSSTYDIKPIYRDWPIVKDVIDKHIREGRAAADFAFSFPFKKADSVATNVGILKNIAADVSGKQMPPRYFTVLPWYPDLKWDEREAIVNWSFESALLLSPYLSISLEEINPK